MASFISTASKELLLGLGLSLILFLAGLLKLLWGSWSVKGPKEKKFPLPPGRFGIPLIGETLEYLRTHKEGLPWKFFDERILKYGETFKISFLMCPTVVLASPAGNKLAFSNINTSWPASVVSVVGPESILGQAVPRVIHIRNALAMFLRPDALQHYPGIVEAILARFIADHLQDKPRIVLFPLMKKLAFSIACEVLLGCRDRNDQETLLLHFNTMVKGLFHFPINIPGTRYHGALVATEAIRTRLQAWIDERRRGLDAGLMDARRQDVLSHLVRYTDGHGNPLSDMEIKNNILLLIFAGHDTTTTVATITCKYLALNPEILDEVYKENKEIAARKASNEHLTWDDLRKMTLSWRVVQETMRLTPPASGMMRTAPHDMSFNGFRIPKSWKIMCSPYSTHRNPKYFPDPEKFDPSRFEGTGPAPFTYVPFGGGPRMCPGNEFARMEILLILHHLVTRFSWTLEDPNEPITVDPMPFPVKGLPILLQPRDIA